MPDLAEDIARQVAENEARLVPEEGQTGYFLAVTGQSPLSYAFRQPPDDEIPRYPGSPDGVLSAPIDSLVRNTVDHTVWINTDGDTAWEPVGSAVDGDTYIDDGDNTGATTVDYAAAHVHRVRMTGNITLTLSGATTDIACGLTLYLVQDGTGSRLVTWPGSVKWPFGSAPVLSPGVNKIDIVVLETVDGGTTWFANLAGKAYA